MDPTVTYQSKEIMSQLGERETMEPWPLSLLSAVPSSLQAQYGLTDEVQQLEGTIRALQQKRTESQ